MGASLLKSKSITTPVADEAGVVIGMKHFTAIEFGVWWLLMNRKQLALLDLLREKSGFPIMISPAHGSLGRESGTGKHNVLLSGGQVIASDIMPYKIFGGKKVSLSSAELVGVFNIAKSIGFGGVGIYPDWMPFAGLHVDVRPIIGGHVATWGAIKTVDGQKYYGADYVSAYSKTKLG